MPQPPAGPAFIARDIRRRAAGNAGVIHRAMTSMLTGADATDRMLPELKMPVLLVWGGEDRITPESQAETMRRLLPRSELDVIEGCGHLAPSQCADRIGPKVVAFLKK
jgi:pimeloyl-ACP methyl ester carboxylesterase